jgi:hypothetical protein
LISMAKYFFTSISISWLCNCCEDFYWTDQNGEPFVCCPEY